MAQFPILTSDGDTIVTSDSFAVVVEGGVTPTTDGLLLVPRDLNIDLSAVFSPVDGTVLAQPALSACELGSIAPSGIMALLRESGGHTQAVDLYRPDYSLITSVAVFAPWPRFAPIQSDNSTGFYVSDGATTNMIVTQLSEAGTIGSSWTVVNSSAAHSLAVSRAQTILYYTVGRVMKRWDLVNDVALADLFTLAVGDNFGFDLYVLPDDTLLVSVQNISNAGEVRRYSAAGTVLQTYDLGPDATLGSGYFVGMDPTTQTTFWARIFPTPGGETNTYLHIDISSGTLLHSFSASNKLAGGEIPFCCPFFALAATTIASTTFPIRRLRRFAL
jgi:hypothetical protein